MEIPKFFETFIPILEVLSDGRVMEARGLKDIVIKKYYSELTPDQLTEKTASGHNLIAGRIYWGKVYLKLAKLLEYPERGKVKITDKGLRALNSGPVTLDDIKKDPDFQNREKLAKDSAKDTASDESTPDELIDEGLKQINAQLKVDLSDKLSRIDHYYFEKIVLKLLKKMGYGEFIETPKSRDGGIDGIMNEDALGIDMIYVQTKHYSPDNIVHEPSIRNFIGAMDGKTGKGIFVTTSKFDEKAVRAANQSSRTIVLIDGEKLIDLMIRYNVGVQTVNTYEIKEIDGDFFEEEG